ncbi:hypothetical protein F7725_004247 [Dissostichus mawsoni]|uniref:Uncharacterized protein n=1 Tax=Dissostichus mawsoni TaxID=36200 RepID=A0A7J5XIW0_DISMA|nr:hypothetical protein F7725_004247 [Dissostichus mawsoni]
MQTYFMDQGCQGQLVAAAAADQEAIHGSALTVAPPQGREVNPPRHLAHLLLHQRGQEDLKGWGETKSESEKNILKYGESSGGCHVWSGALLQSQRDGSQHVPSMLMSLRQAALDRIWSHWTSLPTPVLPSCWPSRRCRSGNMSPKETKLRVDAVSGSTAYMKERVRIRSDAMTAPNDRQTTWNQIEKLFKQWQTRGLIPADDQPAPTKAHRKAVTDYENGEYLQQQEAWIKAGRPSWYGSARIAMNKAEIRKTQVVALILHLKYVVIGTVNMYVVGILSSAKQLRVELNRRLGEHSRRMEEELKRRGGSAAARAWMAFRASWQTSSPPVRRRWVTMRLREQSWLWPEDRAELTDSSQSAAAAGSSVTLRSTDRATLSSLYQELRGRASGWSAGLLGLLAGEGPRPSTARPMAGRSCCNRLRRGLQSAFSRRQRLQAHSSWRVSPTLSDLHCSGAGTRTCSRASTNPQNSSTASTLSTYQQERKPC